MRSSGEPAVAFARAESSPAPADAPERAPEHTEEHRLQRRLALLEGENAVLELVARGAGAEHCLRRLVDAAEALFPDAVAAVCRVENGRRLAFVAGARVPAPARERLDGAAVDDLRLPEAIAISRREPVTIADVFADPAWPALRPHLHAAGARAAWIQPVLDRDGDSLGTLALLFAEARTARAGELETVDALSALASVVLEHERRAEALRSADQRFASLSANLPGVVYQRVVTPEGDIFYTYISEGARELFGVSPEDVLADPGALFECHGPEYRESFRRNLIEASRELRMWDVEAQLVTRDGSVKWGHAIARPRRLPDGSVVWDGLILDATRLKQANLELAAANRAKTEFLANMSHELRTPLNAILGFSEIMRDERFGPLGSDTYRGYAADIYDSGAHLLGVINDILDLAKIEAGRLDLNEEDLDVCALITSSTRLVRERAEEHAITLETALPAHLPPLRGDERKLKQTLINLLSNAVKFTPDGGRIRVAARLTDEGGVEIVVTDTGIGIPAADLDTVFDPFVQVDGGLDRQFEGTGLGLPLSRAMVELHGGTLTLDSVVGEGTTARVYLPAARVSA